MRVHFRGRGAAGLRIEGCDRSGSVPARRTGIPAYDRGGRSTCRCPAPTASNFAALSRRARQRAQMLVASGMDQRVLQTAAADRHAPRRCRCCGALQKPILLADLKRHLRQCIEQRYADQRRQRLTAALDKREIKVHYQPKATRVAPGRWIVEGVEALARWQSSVARASSRRCVSFRSAEKNGVRSAGSPSRVLETATVCNVRAWDAVGLQLSVAINLSPQLLNDLVVPRPGRAHGRADRCRRPPHHFRSDRKRRAMFASRHDHGRAHAHAREELRPVDRRLPAPATRR